MLYSKAIGGLLRGEFDPGSLKDVASPDLAGFPGPPEPGTELSKKSKSKSPKGKKSKCPKVQ